jgi:hypothetical protein
MVGSVSNADSRGIVERGDSTNNPTNRSDVDRSGNGHGLAGHMADSLNELVRRCWSDRGDAAIAGAGSLEDDRVGCAAIATTMTRCGA